MTAQTETHEYLVCYNLYGHHTLKFCNADATSKGGPIGFDEIKELEKQTSETFGCQAICCNIIKLPV